MDLALNIQQRLICHKTQPNNQPSAYVEIAFDRWDIVLELFFLWIKIKCERSSFVDYGTLRNKPNITTENIQKT